jgi:putative endonuclease
LLCRGGTYYTGYTKNVEERALLHANGRGARYTKSYPPLKVAYVETLPTRSEAIDAKEQSKNSAPQQKKELINSQKPKDALILAKDKFDKHIQCINLIG